MSNSSAKNEWGPTAPTVAQVQEFFAQIKSGRITRRSFQTFLRSGNSEKTIPELISEWKEFYLKYFKIKADFSGINITIPEDPEFTRLIIVAQGITINQIYDVCAASFPCQRYRDDLDKWVYKNDRNPKKGNYAVWFRDRQEADEELADFSADQLAEKNILGITLLERLVYEYKYFKETGEHLDILNWTLCSGSRGGGGPVPGVGWRGGKFKVDWAYSCGHARGLRSRVAVPCLPKAD